MKVFFNSSLTGRDEYEENYRLIDKILKEAQHKVFSAVFLCTAEDVEKETEEDANKYYSDLSKWIKESDVLVFEASYPSIGIGHEINQGLHLGKPTIVLYEGDKKPYVLEAIRDERLQIYKYDKQSLKHTLFDALELANDQQDTRFTMLLQSDITNHLDDVFKGGKARSEYIRGLIRKDMKKK